MSLLRIALFAVSLSAAALPVAALPAADLPVPSVDVHEDAPHRDAPVTAAAATDLRGTFEVTAGSCAGAVTGSWFRMVQPGGTPESGPFVENADSPCADKTYTPLRPGTDGGLISGSHQPQPSAPFDGTGNGTAARIVRPQRFFGVDFAVATNPTDPQTGTDTPAPVIRRDGSTLSGDLPAYAVAWNRQHFNQGAPKPDGSSPGQTKLPSGTIDASTKAYRLEWASTIVGGPFNNFTGLWHLEGTFDGALGDDAGAVAQPPASVPDPPAGGTAAPTTPGTTPDTGPALPAAAGLATLAAAVAARAVLRRHA